MNTDRAFTKGWLLAIPLLLSAGLAGELLRGADQLPATDGSAASGRRNSPAVFAGIKRAAAGLAWVGAYGRWHRRDAAAMTEAMEWAVQLDPETLLYWLDGARMMAYDVPAWYRDMSMSERAWQQLRREQLAEAIAWLDRGREFHPEQSALPIEQAVLWWTVAKNARAAEQALAAAQDCADAPWFVARIRAEMLVRLDRPQEALALLRAELPRLDAMNPLAMRAVVEERIRDLSRLAER